MWISFSSTAREIHLNVSLLADEYSPNMPAKSPCNSDLYLNLQVVGGEFSYLCLVLSSHLYNIWRLCYNNNNHVCDALYICIKSQSVTAHPVSCHFCTDMNATAGLDQRWANNASAHSMSIHFIWNSEAVKQCKRV